LFLKIFYRWPSHASAPCPIGHSSQISGAAASIDAKCHYSNQQIYLGCYFLLRSSQR
jgi:hypothetical protein